MPPAAMDHDAEALVSPAEAKPSFFRRKRRSLLLSALGAIVVVTMAIVWASTSGDSSSSSSSTPSSSTLSAAKPSTTNASKAGTTVNGVKIPPRRKSIVVLGDSTTQYGGGQTGWEVKLHAAYVRSLDTINRGLSGYNTRIFLQYAMPGLIEEATNYYDPLVVVMWFGVNDATLVNGPNKAQHVPLDEYKANLIEMIRQYRSAVPNAKVLLLSPVYIDEVQRRKAVGTPLDRDNEETEKYAKACTEIKEEVFKDDDAVGYIDVYNYFLEKYPSDDQRALVLRDGLHFGPDGDNIFYDLVKAKIETMVPASELTHSQFPGDNVYIHY